MADNVFSKGKFLYIEPTNPFLTLPDNAVTFPYEDYSMGVNLEVTISDRFSCGQEGAKQISFSTDKGTISFFGGSGTNPEDGKQGYLSTNFTEINPANVGRGNKETLGIESINISYQQWFYPVVNIRFVDVRGASLFMAQEKGLRDTNARGNTDISQLDSGSFFKAIFACPSPVFKLTVKGFYGEPVSYNLRMSSFKADFDSNTGNVIASVDFIGNMYGVYTEIPLIYTAIAPFLDRDNDEGVQPGKYWQNQIENGRFRFDNGAEIPTFNQFYEKLRVAGSGKTEETREAERQAKNAIGEAQSIISIVTELRKKYPFDGFKSVNTSKTGETDAISNTYHYYLNDSSSLYRGNNNVRKESVRDFYDSVKSFAEKNPSYSYLTTFVPKDYEKDDCFCTYIVDGVNSVVYQYEGEEIKSDVTKNRWSSTPDNNLKVVTNNDVVEQVLNIEKEAIKDGKIHYLHLMNTTILKKLDEIVTQNKATQSHENKKLQDLNYKSTNEILGFDLTIRNVFNMLFAHLETYIHQYYSMLNDINYLIASGDERTFNVRPWSNWKDSDVANVKVPPFPLCIDVKDDGDIRREIPVWPEPDTAVTTVSETKFVEKMLKAATMYSNEAKKLLEEERKKAEAEQAEENKKVNVEERKDFVPLTLFDMVNYRDTTNYPNPYKYIAEKAFTSKTKAQLIVAVFALRCYYAFYMLNNTFWNTSKVNDYIAYIETLNILRAFGGNLDKSVLELLPQNVNETQKSQDKPWNINGNAIFNNKDYGFINLNGTYLFPKTSEFDEMKDFLNNAEYNKFIFLGKSDNANDFSIQNTSNFFNQIEYNVRQATANENVFKKTEIENIEKEMNNFFAELEHKKTISEEYESCRFVNSNGIVDNFDDVTSDTVLTDGNDNVVFGYIGDEKSDKPIKTGVFNLQLYVDQNNPLSKAYLFLFSLPLKRVRSERKNKMCSGTNLKLELLREGAYYWRKREIVSGKGEPIIVDGNMFHDFKGNPELIPVRNTRLTLSYKKNTIFRDFRKWSEFSNTYIEKATEARINGLIKYFEDFAKSNDFKQLATLETIFLQRDILTDNEERVCQEALVNIMTDRVTFVDYSVPVENKDKNKFDIDDITITYQKVLEKLRVNYEETDGSRENNPVNTESVESDIFNYDIYLSTYLVLKDMYDKFFANLTSDMFTLKHKNEPKEVNNEFDKFLFVDSYYNDIGDKLLVNGQYLCDLIQDTVFGAVTAEDVPRKLEKKYSVFQFMSEVCEKNNLTFLALPQRFGLSVNENGYKEIENMFKPHPFNSNIFDDNKINGSYIALYPYKPSERLDIRDDTGSYAYKQDSFDLWDDEQLPVSLASLTDTAIPAFAVSFAKQNQGLFKNISLTTGNQQITEHSIVAQMDIAARGSIGPGESTLYGQDLYRVYSNYSYQCSVEMMGNLQIMPLMYFQLNNIPMWHGAYMIISVEHNIVAGNITTKFTGVRVNKHAMPFLNNDFIYIENGEVASFTDDEDATEDNDGVHEEGRNDRGWNTPRGEESPEETEPRGGHDGSNDNVAETRSPRRRADRKRAVTEAVKSIFMPGCNTKSTAALCARWTYNLAQSFVKNMERLSINKCHDIVNAGANAYDDALINRIASLGYTVVSEFSNLTGQEVKDKIQKTFKYDYGDVLIYKGGPNGVGKNGKYHAQFCVKDAYNRNAEGYDERTADKKDKHENISGWACDLIDNYGTSFVYNKYINNNWKWKVTLLRYYDNDLDRIADEENGKENTNNKETLSPRKRKIVNFLKQYEGNYSNDKDDSGGCTKWGVTIATYRSYFGTDKTCKDVSGMTEDEFIQVFNGFYNAMKGDSINNDSICHLVFDMFWMSGTKAIKKIQELFGLTADGVVGTQTLNALNNGTAKDIFKKIWDMRDKWLNDMVKESPSKKKFLTGWLKRLKAIVFGG